MKTQRAKRPALKVIRGQGKRQKPGPLARAGDAAPQGLEKRGVYEDQTTIGNIFRYTIIDSRGDCIRVIEVPANRGGGDALEAELWKFLNDEDPIAPIRLL